MADQVLPPLALDMSVPGLGRVSQHLVARQVIGPPNTFEAIRMTAVVRSV